MLYDSAKNFLDVLTAHPQQSKVSLIECWWRATSSTLDALYWLLPHNFVRGAHYIMGLNFRTGVLKWNVFDV
ncbi:MAG: hypothetical protein RR061_09890, partial [Muribaculaceae bacterium]